jgi:hypothetical protein
MPRSQRSRGLIFALVVTTTLLAGAAYVAWAALRGEENEVKSGTIAAVRAEPHVVFQNVRGQAGGSIYAHAALASVDQPSRGRVTTNLVCERVYYAADSSLCLTSQQNVLGGNYYSATITGPNFRQRHKLRVAGIPIRARISPDGRLGASTGFVTGHSYADDNFSTKTVLIDMERGKVLADLEKDFTVTKDGKVIKEADFNFWGVTFARKPGRFYATLGTGKKRYLIEGDARTRRAKVITDGVECPSLSPDNKRIAYKKKAGNSWRFHVLDLATLKETPLAEKRGIDDQVEWLDDNHILYGFSPDIWVVPADGSGSPRKFLSRALSPAVVRS